MLTRNPSPLQSLDDSSKYLLLSPRSVLKSVSVKITFDIYHYFVLFIPFLFLTCQNFFILTVEYP